MGTCLVLLWGCKTCSVPSLVPHWFSLVLLWKLWIFQSLGSSRLPILPHEFVQSLEAVLPLLLSSTLKEWTLEDDCSKDVFCFRAKETRRFYHFLMADTLEVVSWLEDIGTIPEVPTPSSWKSSWIQLVPLSPSLWTWSSHHLPSKGIRLFICSKTWMMH